MKIAKYIILFLIFFNSGALLLQQTGVNDHLGVQISAGDNEQLESAQDSAESVNPGGSDLGTLFGFYTTITDTLGVIMNAINPGAAMLQAAVQNEAWDQIVTYSFSGMWAITGFTILEFLRGADI